MSQYNSLSDLLLPGVDLYQSQADFTLRTGLACPTFNHNQDVKYWRDLKALTSAARDVTYANALVMGDGNKPLAGPDGNPMLGPIMLKREIAAAVNIPAGTPNELGADGPVISYPVRALYPNEELVFMPPFGTVSVRDTNFPLPGTDGFTVADRATLQAIAAKVGAVPAIRKPAAVTVAKKPVGRPPIKKA